MQQPPTPHCDHHPDALDTLAGLLSRAEVSGNSHLAAAVSTTEHDDGNINDTPPALIRLAEELPDLFAREVLQRMDARTRAMLAETSKTFRAAVASSGLPRKFPMDVASLFDDPAHLYTRCLRSRFSDAAIDRASEVWRTSYKPNHNLSCLTDALVHCPLGSSFHIIEMLMFDVLLYTPNNQEPHLSLYTSYLTLNPDPCTLGTEP
jgi:hypothetical protein